MSSHRRGREAAAEPVLQWGDRLVPDLPAFPGGRGPLGREREPIAWRIPAAAAARAAAHGGAGGTGPGAATSRRGAFTAPRRPAYGAAAAREVLPA